MGWETYVRRPHGPARHAARIEPRRARGTERDYGPFDVGRLEAAAQLERYDSYVAQLVNLHAECGEQWHWETVSMSPPSAPAFSARAETAARAALQSFRPGVADQITGRATRRCARLLDRVDDAIDADRRRHEAALAAHRIAYWRWITASKLAAGVLGLDEDVCRDALRFVDAFGDLAAFGSRVELESIEDGVATLACAIDDPDIVPHAEVTLTPTGLLATRSMPEPRYWRLYRDHVCSCAIRIARETFAALPVDTALINVRNPDGPILGIQCTAAALHRLDVASYDPATLVALFPHRMQFHSAVGFRPIEALTAEDSWMTS